MEVPLANISIEGERLPGHCWEAELVTVIALDKWAAPGGLREKVQNAQSLSLPCGWMYQPCCADESTFVPAISEHVGFKGVGD